MNILKQIEKTREYLLYIEEHVMNVNKAWGVIADKCRDMRVIWDDFYYWQLAAEIKNHDLSKMSEQEFVQYRKAFYPTEDEKRHDLGDAWEHHKQNNPHHWEKWTQMAHSNHNMWEVHCTHMVIDWMAMGYKFGDTAQQYYEKNKDKIDLPEHAVKFIYEIFERIG